VRAVLAAQPSRKETEPVGYWQDTDIDALVAKQMDKEITDPRITRVTRRGWILSAQALCGLHQLSMSQAKEKCRNAAAKLEAAKIIGDGSRSCLRMRLRQLRQSLKKLLSEAVR
jgi:hypothetical protein